MAIRTTYFIPPPSTPVMNVLWDQGTCTSPDVDRELFFHPEGERGTDRLIRVLRAKAVCRECPVTAQCAGWATESRQRYGTWGGLSEDDREAIAVALRAAG